MGCRIQAVAGLPLPKDVGLRVGASLMLNVLGDPDGTDMEKTKAELNRLTDIAGAAPHWYGKATTRKGRKMGYIRLLTTILIEYLSFLPSMHSA